MNEFSTFIRDEQKRPTVLTSARFQTFFKKHSIKKAS